MSELRFNVTGTIPPGSTIQWAVLRMWNTTTAFGVEDQSYVLGWYDAEDRPFATDFEFTPRTDAFAGVTWGRWPPTSSTTSR